MPISKCDFEGPPIAEEDIQDLENLLGVEFPVSYRTFLLRHNGGRPTPEDIFGDEQSGSVMDYFFAVKHDRLSSTIAHMRTLAEGRVPADLLPIGNDAGGSLICMGIADKNYGQIFFWAKDDEAGPDRKPWRRNIWLVARDFDAFLASFRAELDDE